MSFFTQTLALQRLLSAYASGDGQERGGALQEPLDAGVDVNALEQALALAVRLVVREVGEQRADLEVVVPGADAASSTTGGERETNARRALGGGRATDRTGKRGTWARGRACPGP